jgi:predicted DNA-binding antitoxin AbrB/MazE fold protein
MDKAFEAVYKNGVLRSTEALELPDNQHVMVKIIDLSANSQDVAGYFTPEEWDAAAKDQISLEEVYQALSSTPDSLSDAVDASREDR